MTTLTNPDTDERLELAPDVPWQTVVWDDPVNLMSYVVRIFREYFGFSHDIATKRMLALHHDGHALLAEGARAQMALPAPAIPASRPWATAPNAPP